MIQVQAVDPALMPDGSIGAESVRLQLVAPVKPSTNSRACRMLYGHSTEEGETDMQSYPFIGGAHDGLSFPVTDDVESVKLPTGVTGSKVYVRDTLSVGDASVTIYRHESLSSSQVLNRLVEHYKAWCVNRPGGRRN